MEFDFDQSPPEHPNYSVDNFIATHAVKVYNKDKDKGSETPYFSFTAAHNAYCELFEHAVRCNDMRVTIELYDYEKDAVIKRYDTDEDRC